MEHLYQMLGSISQSLRLPAICALCKQLYRGPEAVCEDCIASFDRTDHACQYCAHPLPDADFSVCGNCIKKKNYFDKAYIAYRYEDPLRSLLHQFKYEEKLYLSSFFARLIQDALDLNDEKPDYLIPMPMHPTRLKERGFNQAVVLTQLLSKKLKIPYLLNHCRKLKNTVPQASLKLEERQKNLRHAFEVKRSELEHVAIIDDLLTTGSTANELAKKLKDAGVKRVDVWCCARAARDVA